MKDITTTPTAELLAEWEKLESRTFSLEYLAELRVYLNDRKASIAAELDRRVVDAGVSIDRDGIPNFANCGHARDGSFTLYSHATRENVSAKELRDLLSWLLTKGGNRE